MLTRNVFRGLIAASVAGVLVTSMIQPARADQAQVLIPAALSAPSKTVTTAAPSTSTNQSQPQNSTVADRADVVLNGWGDARGYHLTVASASSSWAWREVAVLRPGLVEQQSWLGYQCVSGDGRYAAVTVLPSAAINSAPARDHGAVGYSVDLVKDTVRPVAAGIGFKYHSPGCGLADTAEFTLNPGTDQASTVVLSADLTTGKITQRSTVAGQITSVVPTEAGPVGAMGAGLVRIPATGKPIQVAGAGSAAFDLRPTADGGVAFLSTPLGGQTTQVAEAQAGKVNTLGSGPRLAVRLFQGRLGHPVLVGATALSAGSDVVRVDAARAPGGPAASSLSGKAVLGEAMPGLAPTDAKGAKGGTVSDAASSAAQAAPPVLDTLNGQVLQRPAASSNRPVTVKLPAVIIGTTSQSSSKAAASNSGSTATPLAAGAPKCAVPRLAENRQVLQPWPAQVDWASQMAEQNLLTGSAEQRPVGYANLGLAAYAANTDFAKVALHHPSSDSWDSVPRSVYDAIMAQESNWSQASWHALPGIAGDPLIADYYGAAGGINSINYTNADCGYGVGQVTTGMTAAATTPYSTNGKTKIAVDYEENIAAGLQILEKTWNQLYDAGVTANGGDPRYLENWYFAAWAYNTGIQPNTANGNTTGCTPGPSCVGADGTWGLGWTNNPQNADYLPNRSNYLQDSYADAAHPGLWPYQERIFGWMASPLIRLSKASYSKPTYNGGSTWILVPSPADFCTVVGNKCDPTYNAADPSLSYCTLTDRQCWWHDAVSWSGNCSLQCATSSYAATAGSSEPAPGASPHPATCSLDGDKVASTSSGAPIIVDESQSQPPLDLVGCVGTPNWSQGGTFSMNYGKNAAGDNIGAIDTHQLGAGFGGHTLFSHTETGNDPSVINTGTWTPSLPKTQYYKIKVHLPSTGASATDVVYNVYPGGGAAPWKVRVNQFWGTEQWATIGTFGMQNGGYVELSNTSSDTAYGDVSYSNYDVAWDAIAFIPLGGTVGVPLGGPLTVVDEPAGSNPSLVASGCTCRTAGDPVNTSTGYFADSFTDLSTPGRGMPLNFTRTYSSALASPSGPNSALAMNGPFGYGWSFSYNLSTVTNGTTGNITVTQEDGSQVDFVNTSGVYTPALPRYDATLVKSGSTYVFTRRGRQIFDFDTATGQLTSETDPSGVKASPAYGTTLTYDTNGHLSAITDPANRKYTLTWTGSHITGLTDTAGRQVTYGYDASNNLTDVYGVGTTRTPSVLNDDRYQYTYTTAHLMASMREPKAYGSTVTPAPVTGMLYDSSERVIKQTDQLGRSTTFIYGPDASANLAAGQTQVTDPAGHKTIDTYSNGLLVSETRGAGSSDAGTWTYSYDPVTLGTSSITDPEGRVQTFTYDDRGDRTSASDARGYTTSYDYDVFGDETSMVDALGVKTTYGYDDAGHIKTSTGTNDGTLSYGLLTSTQQQAIGESAEVPDGNPPTATVHSTSAYYDDAAHPADLSRLVNARGFTTAKTYDAFGDVVSSTDPMSDQTRYGYDTDRGWLTSTVSPNGVAAGITPGCTPPAKGCATYGHDAYGNVTLATDPLTNTTAATYDADGNQTSTTDGNHQQSIVTFDFADQATQVKRPDNSLVKTSFNADGTIDQSIDGAGNTTTYGYDGQGRQASVQDAKNRTTTTALDPAGNISTVKDPDNRVATYTHDADGEVTAISYSDPATPSISSVYDADGRRSQLTDGTGTSSWSYDDFGQVISQANGAGSTVGYAYDPVGNQTSVVYPGVTGRTVTQIFDKANRLTSVKDWNAKTTSFGYDADNDLTLTTYPNGTTVTRTPDNADQLGSTTLKSGTSTLATISYPRDPDGQLSGETPTSVPGSTQTFGYTPLEQVKSSTASGIATPFSYDAADNPLQVGSDTQTFDDADQLCWSTTDTPPPTPVCATPPSGSTSYGYNAEGQRSSVATGSAITTYGYDQEGHLVSVAKTGMSATYHYDGTGQRASKTVNGSSTPFTWDTSTNLLYDGSTAYLYGPGGVSIEQVGVSATQWYFTDQLNSTRALIDSSGVIVGGYGYSPYGVVTSHTGTVSTPLQYADQYTDAETGFQYLRARYYDPATAQFLTVDPLAEKTGSRYDYAKQNPMAFTDPSGLITVGLCFGVSAALLFGRAWTVCPIVVALDTRNHHVSVGSTSTYAHNWGSPALGVSVTDEFSNAQNIRQLGGKFYEGGLSGPVGDVNIPVTAGGFYGQCPDAPGGSVIGGGLGYGPGLEQLPAVEVHGGVSNTNLKTWFGDDLGQEVKQ